MNNRVLKIVAGLLALGAVGVAVLGVRLSQQKPSVTVTAAPPAPTASAVVAARPIAAGHAITKEDVAVRGLAALPDGAYAALSDVVGRVPSVDVAAGDALRARDFVSTSLAALLRPGERAVAVRVDEVIGLGGFAQPGDRVDVLFYVSASRETGERTLSQVLIQDARVLTMGEESLLSQQAKAGAATPSLPGMGGEGGAGKAEKAEREAKERRASQRSAVLAVAEGDAARLMLAASAGQLRLALRPVAGGAAPQGRASSPALALGEMTGSRSAKPSAAPPAALPNAAAPEGVRKPRPAGGGIIIHEGDKVRAAAVGEGARP